MITFENYLPIKISKEYTREAIHIKSIHLFLSLVKIAQKKKNRIAYYTYCCSISRYENIEHKTYATWLTHYSKENYDEIEKINLNLFNTDQDNITFYALENFYRGHYIEEFTSDYFYDKVKDYPYLLPYNNYILKLEFEMYIILWCYVERVRQRKYNEYLKTHPKINFWENWNIRTVYTQYPPFIWLREWNQHAWLRIWILEVIKKRFQIIFTRGKIKENVISTLKKTNNWFSLYKQSNELKLYKLSSKIEFLTRKHNLFIRKTIRYRWSIDAAYSIVKYHHWFPNQVRLDYTYMWQCVYMTATSPQMYYKRIKLDEAVWQEKMFRDFVNKQNFDNIILLEELNTSTNNFWFIPHYKLRYKFFTLLICTGITQISPLFFWTSLYWRLGNEIFSETDWTISWEFVQILKKNSLFKSYYWVNNLLLDKIYDQTQYDYWRSFNIDYVYKIDDGRLTPSYFELNVYIDLYIFNRYRQLWSNIYSVWNSLNQFISLDRNTARKKGFLAKKLKVILRKLKAKKTRPYPVWIADSIKAIRKLPNNLSPKTMPLMIYDTIRTVYLQLPIASWKYGFLTFHCLSQFTEIDIETLNCELEGNKLHALFQSQMITRRYLTNYKAGYNEFRRAPFQDEKQRSIGTTVIGPNVDRLQDWLEHRNWMRIIGLTPVELPYYFVESYYNPHKKPDIDQQNDWWADHWWRYIADLREVKKKKRQNYVDCTFYTTIYDK